MMIHRFSFALVMVAVSQLAFRVRADDQRRFNFENDIIPILSRYGCNSSGCHGKAEGQNGFKLSVFGFDPDADYQAITMEGRGRRVFPGSPTRSLLLQKICGASPHGGGVRIREDRPEYALLRAWIAAGTPRGNPDDPTVTGIALTPRKRTLAAGAQQALKVIARWSDGRREDVTRLATFRSNNEGLATVNEDGLVLAGKTPGAVAIMAGYMGRVDVFHALLPHDGVIDYPSLPENNFIDSHVNARLRELKMVPAGQASDAKFMRRAYLDITGTLPTADEAREFLNDTRKDRRARLVDSLLQRPEYAEYWALKWSDLLRVNRRELGHKSAYEYYRWIRDSFTTNKPLDRFAREIITAEGPLTDAPAGQFYKVVKKPAEMASALSQVFLGVRIECAQCHHHPFDRWSQTDYYGMEAFFTQVSFKKSAIGESLLAASKRVTKHPRTGKTIFAHALATEAPEKSPPGDRRILFADWLTDQENAWFGRNIANRIWAHFMGRGLVEPVDDMRLTNPPSNPELLDALAAHFVEHDFDQHELIRVITGSRAYGRAATVNQTNRMDEQNYSRFLFKPLDAEVLFDAVCQKTGVREKFAGVPTGVRAIGLWDSEVPHYFLKLFGRPVRATACECERIAEPTVGQVLHLLNSPEIQAKLSHEGGTIARLTRELPNDSAVVEQLYLSFFSRYPSETEMQAAIDYVAAQADRRGAFEDLAWSMINAMEFLFNQ